MENCDGVASVIGHRDRRAEALGDLGVLLDETLCAIIEYLSPRDVARLACVSSVMYILCNEEPLWMSLCLKCAKSSFQYKGSWKKTTLHLQNAPQGDYKGCRKPLHFDGFNSLFLYRRLYRCHTTLNGFSFDDGNVERKKDLLFDEFSKEYDAKKPVLLTGLCDSWPATKEWTIDRLVQKYGDISFRISQRSPQKIKMKFKDYISYINLQHDEDPLYVFDDKFGEIAPDLLKDYRVPYLFQEDWFDILDKDSRPPFRWLIVGPERSGASWHVDPALTSAWNTLLCGRKRWALYPPGRVPSGVTVNVNDEDGDVNIETPTSLQWWLDFYPLLADEDKPIECTQLPGETIYVPSGWWHCVLNLETTVAVTQNYVNDKNFEFVCLDMAPGYHHKGVCRAGLLAFDEGDLEDAENGESCDEDNLTYSDLSRKEKRIRISEHEQDQKHEGSAYGVSKRYEMWRHGFSYDTNFLSKFLDKEIDHYAAPWCPGNSIGQREMRQWLSKLWVVKPKMRDLIWKGACLALNADKWLGRLKEICDFYCLPFVTDDDRLPIGTGSNPVYLLADCVIKLFVEGGLEASIYGLGAELEFYNMVCQNNSPLKNHVPDVLASGILYLENGSYQIVPWDGKSVPDVISKCNWVTEAWTHCNFPFGIWSKKLFEYKNSGASLCETLSSCASPKIWPFIITKRCKGKILAELRNSLSWEDTLHLASFLGEQLRNLHLLPYPSVTRLNITDAIQKMKLSSANGCVGDIPHDSNIPAEWEIFVRTLSRRKRDLKSRLEKWGSPIPRSLVDKVDDYIQDGFFMNLLHIHESRDVLDNFNPCSWIHSDIMDDNIHMEPFSRLVIPDAKLNDNVSMNGHTGNEEKSWHASHILDFSDLSIGDPILDVIPIYLDVFRGDNDLLNQLLQSYKLSLISNTAGNEADDKNDRVLRISYRAMCYCILHEENVLGAIFSMWKELSAAQSWEEVEEKVWGGLNGYKGAS